MARPHWQIMASFLALFAMSGLSADSENLTQMQRLVMFGAALLLEQSECYSCSLTLSWSRSEIEMYLWSV